MKRIIKISFLLLVITIGSFANLSANDNPTFNFKGERILIIDLNDWKSANVNAEIRDLQGTILHNEIIKKGQLPAIKYDLRNLPLGSYKIILDGGNMKSINTFEVELNSIRLQPENEKLIFKPVVSINKEEIDMNFLALGEDVIISIMDEQGEIFSQELEGLATINRRFDISKLSKGEYVFIVNAENQYFTQGFRK